MLVIDCQTHGSKVLLSERRIRRVHNTASEIVVDVDCWCGTRVRLHTGGRRPAAPATASAREVASLSR
jgi:hypothetical protein